MKPFIHTGILLNKLKAFVLFKCAFCVWLRSLRLLKLYRECNSEWLYYIFLEAMIFDQSKVYNEQPYKIMKKKNANLIRRERKKIINKMTTK